MTPINWATHLEAERLRRDGLTQKAIGEALGISVAKVAAIMGRTARIQRCLGAYSNIPQWHHGLSSIAAVTLLQKGFKSREDCLYLTRDDLNIHQGRVALAAKDERFRGEGLWSYAHHTIPLEIANEVRAWMGVVPIALNVNAGTGHLAANHYKTHGV